MIGAPIRAVAGAIAGAIAGSNHANQGQPA